MSKQIKFILAIALQLAVILIIIIFKFSIFTGGTEVMLRIQPVDPRDPLRGDYVMFSYDISSISSYQFEYSSINNGDKIYVPLRKQGADWRISGMISKSKPNNGVFIKGVVKGSSLMNFEQPRPVNPFEAQEKLLNNQESIITIIYGIEEYFIPEGTGRFERFLGNNNFAKVAIDENGNAVLKQIFVDNKIWP